MSARDVDDAFEKAYKRLFSSSGSAEADSGAQSSISSGSRPLAGSSKATRTVAGSSRKGSTGPSTSNKHERQQRLREAAGPHTLSRQVLGSEASLGTKDRRPPPAQPALREQLAQPRASHPGLKALARQSAAPSNAKGKVRARSRVETDARHAEGSRRSPLIPAAAAPHTSSSIPQAGGLAYYPYPHAQPPYQVSSGPLVAPPGGLMSMPGQAVTWTQPIMSAGLMPTVAYPGFSASVTFSQPQFFASHPQQMQPTITAMPTDPWAQQQYTLQHGAPAIPPSQNPILHHEDAQQGTIRARPESQEQHRVSTSALPTSKPHETILRPVEEAEPNKVLSLGPDHRKMIETMLRRVGEKVSATSSAHTSPTAQAEQYRQSVRNALREKLQNGKPKPRKKKYIPLFDENGVRIPKKRGRPRTHGLLYPGVLKTEASEIALSTSVADDCLPLGEDAGLPYKMETHTLFIHPSRRLRWLARRAIAKADQRADSEPPATLSPFSDTRQWARWTFLSSTWAQRPNTAAVTSAPTEIVSPPSPAGTTASQTDPAGLFPREKRRQYVALRKTLHTTVHTAHPRICVTRLVRYLAKVAAAAEQRFETDEDRRRYVERKHRAAKLAKHLLKSRRPTPMDVRRLWAVWARSAHLRGKSGETSRAGLGPQKRRVSFAPQPATTPPPRSPSEAASQDRVKVKLEPESPAAQRGLFSPPRAAVKVEPNTPSLSPAVRVSIKDEPSSETRVDVKPGTGRKSPPFLRRNLHVYRLLGLTDLPLA
ncbi:uncharacterized protein UTRI_00668_B [Ustilago trichophora]|uniref:Uncharacterized protein n=1 Tax=Ustilago trichophora TaxID=86804 RepID=A0A5C3DSS7_9BASI|nr:uncharacterized protein UTRI_00668_B [Ustilago trichophora]